MNAEEAEALDESFASLLAACDEALAAGTPPVDATGPSALPELQPRLARDLACLQALEELWPRRKPAAPVRLGRFEIRRELGRGGYGVVYLAHDSQLGRDVALKVPREDVLLSAELRQRFHHEARAAAGLDHPNLVAVYEAGEDGERCWIAAAYCPGPNLAQWLAGRREPVPERAAAELVAALADGVQHAHSRGVLHRDLKPSNVLLTFSREPPASAPEALTGGSRLSESTAKITDFGLAKLLAGAVGQTRSGDIVGTPAYMAPEQAEGKTREIGTAADVYALGAILYELLTGRPPFQGESVWAVLEQVRSREPAPPRRLRPRLSRDLETICLKCLHKEPGRRYGSAGALADDLRHFLDGEPVQARPVGGVERLLRWCQRKPALAASLAALILVFVAGLVGVIWQGLRASRNAHDAAEQRDLAEQSRRKAHQAIKDYFTLVSENTLLGKPGMDSLRKQLLETALHYYQDFLRERGDDPALQTEVAATYVDVGRINNLIGSKASARSSFQDALALYEKLTRADPANTALQRSRAGTFRLLGNLCADTGAMKDALQALEQSRSLLEDLAARDAANPDLQADVAQSHLGICLVQKRLGQREAAVRSTETARDLLQPLVRAHPDRADLLDELLGSHGELGNLHFAAHAWPQALEEYQQARVLCQQLVDRHPTVPSYQSRLAGIYNNIAAVQSRLDQLDDGLRSMQQVCAIREKVVHENPAVTDNQWLLAVAYANLGKFYSFSSRMDEALQCIAQARPLVEKLIRSNPLPDYRNLLADLYISTGHVRSKLDPPTGVLPAFEQARAILEQLVQDYPDRPTYRLSVGTLLHNYGNELQKVGRLEEARQAFERGRDMFLKLMETDRQVLVYQQRLVEMLIKLGSLLERTGQLERAREAFRQGLDVCTRLHQAQPKELDFERLLATCCRSLGDVERQCRHWDEAERWYRQALAIRVKFVRSHPTLTEVHHELALVDGALAELRLEAGRPEEALPLCEQAVENFDKALEANPGSLEARSQRAKTHELRGRALAKLGRREEAVQAHRQAIDGQKAVLAKAPHLVGYRDALREHYQHLAALYRELGQAKEAAALDLQRQQLGPTPIPW